MQPFEYTVLLINDDWDAATDPLDDAYLTIDIVGSRMEAEELRRQYGAENVRVYLIEAS